MSKGTGGGAGGRPSGGVSPRGRGAPGGGAGRSAPGHGAVWGPGGRRRRPGGEPELSGNRRRDDWYHDGDDPMVAYAGDRRVRSYENDNSGLYRVRPGSVIARVAVVLVLLGLIAALLFLVLG